MLEIIQKYAAKGLYIGLYPIYERKEYMWVAYVMIDGKRNWLKGDPGCTMSAFKSAEVAFKAAITFCERAEKSK